MWQVIAVMVACTPNNECQPFVGEHMSFGQCITTSQMMMADFHRQFPYFDVSKSRLLCAEPRRVDAILKRNQA